MLTVLSGVLRGDPRQEEALIEALALLEAEPPGPELVAAHGALAGDRFVGAAYGDAIAAAERALALAAGLGLPEPAPALGIRGGARCALGEREGLGDMRRALQLAIEQGEGRAAALLHNNLAVVSWQYEGPRAALEACGEGIDFSERRGITQFALAIASMRTTFLAETGESERALAEAEPLAERLQAAGAIVFIEPRSLQLRLLAERGAHQQAPRTDELLARAHESGEPQIIALAFAAAARLLRALDRPQEARALLTELDQAPGARADPYSASVLNELVRSALAFAEPALAARLVAGVEPVTPLQQHAGAACRAQLAEAAGQHAEAAALCAEAAERWHAFGNVPERAYALLGQGRCLAALGKPEAEQPLRQARELFASMGFKPALTETQALHGESGLNPEAGSIAMG